MTRAAIDAEQQERSELLEQLFAIVVESLNLGESLAECLCDSEGLAEGDGVVLLQDRGKLQLKKNQSQPKQEPQLQPQEQQQEQQQDDGDDGEEKQRRQQQAPEVIFEWKGLSLHWEWSSPSSSASQTKQPNKQKQQNDKDDNDDDDSSSGDDWDSDSDSEEEEEEEQDYKRCMVRFVADGVKFGDYGRAEQVQWELETTTQTQPATTIGGGTETRRVQAFDNDVPDGGAWSPIRSTWTIGKLQSLTVDWYSLVLVGTISKQQQQQSQHQQEEVYQLDPGGKCSCRGVASTKNLMGTSSSSSPSSSKTNKTIASEMAASLQYNVTLANLLTWLEAYKLPQLQWKPPPPQPETTIHSAAALFRSVYTFLEDQEIRKAKASLEGTPTTQKVTSTNTNPPPQSSSSSLFPRITAVVSTIQEKRQHRRDSKQKELARRVSATLQGSPKESVTLGGTNGTTTEKNNGNGNSNLREDILLNLDEKVLRQLENDDNGSGTDPSRLLEQMERDEEKYQNAKKKKWRVGDNIRGLVAKGKQASGRASNDPYQFGDLARGILQWGGSSPTSSVSQPKQTTKQKQKNYNDNDDSSSGDDWDSDSDSDSEELEEEQDSSKTESSSK